MTSAEKGPLVWRQLHWTRPLDADRVTALLTQWAAEVPAPTLVIETRARADGIR